MSACRLIRSRAQRPIGLPCLHGSSRRACLAPLLAVAADQTGAEFPQPAQADGTIYQSPPSYPYYQPQPYQPSAPTAPPPPLPPAAAQSPGTPFWVWILVGAAAAWVWGKIQEFRSNPAAAMFGMMNSMNKNKSGASGGNDMAAMMEMMKKMQGAPGGTGTAQGFGGASPFGGMGSPGMTIPTTAQDVTPSGRDGSKFEQNKQAAATPGAAEATAAPSQPADPISQADFTSQKSQPASSSASSSFFADPQAGSATAAASEPASAGASSFFSDTGAVSSEVPAGGQNTEGTEKLIENMLEMVVNNPELQQQMNKFLPENMRNESTWQWIATSPELRKQIASQMAPNFNMSDFQNMPGTTGDAASNVDVKKAMDDMKAQGMDPNNVMNELMGDPEIMELFMKPHVTDALMAIQKDPSVAVNYMSDPDVSKLMTKMMAIQSKQGGGMPMPTAGMPGVPGGASQ